MSRGLSWRQRSILEGLLNSKKPIVAWRDVNYGPTTAETRDDFDLSREQWNWEQSVRRALRSLEARGLVKLDRYCFYAFADVGAFGPYTDLTITHPDNHVPGQTRIMTGVTLTEAGREAALNPKGKS
jgi:hypothetical protein